MVKNTVYPFEPRSAANLLPGQFWAVRLSNGSFACGRVIQLTPSGALGSRVTFLAGLMDWHGIEPPTAESIAGSQCIAQGQAHVKTIRENGRLILGFRGLECDGITPWEFRGAHGWMNSCVQLGLIKVRLQTPDDERLPVISTWGSGVILRLANERFGC